MILLLAPFSITPRLFCSYTVPRPQVRSSASTTPPPPPSCLFFGLRIGASASTTPPLSILPSRYTFLDFLLLFEFGSFFFGVRVLLLSLVIGLCLLGLLPCAR